MSRLRIKYGEHHSQVGDLWLPAGAGRDLLPAVVLIHGGFWQAPYTKPLMTRLAKEVRDLGYVAWNIEYRRVGVLGGGGGWPETCVDVAAAIDHLGAIPGLDLAKVVACGHSAGGQLALWAAARAGAVRLAGVVSLAGICDLEEADRLGLGGGSTAAFLGGHVDDVPEAYALASPAALLPLGVPQVVVHGSADNAVPQEMSARYCERAKAAGDDVTYVPLAGVGHREVIDPTTPAWAATVVELRRLLERQ